MQRHYLNNRRIQGAAEAAPLHSAIRQQTLGSLGTAGGLGVSFA
jgi:hypothetical protein